LGIVSFGAYDLHIINSTINWNGYSSPYSWLEPSAFADASDSHSKIILEESNVTGFPDYDFDLQGSFSDFYLRSSNVNASRSYYPDWISDVRFFTQHLLVVNVTDNFGLTGACAVQVLDNGIVPRLSGLDAELKTLANPTSKIYIPTGETGVGSEWVTEKLTHAKSSSEPVITEYDFSNYTLTARGWGSENYSQTIVNLTDINSIVYVDFKINTFAGGDELSACTITQMLDLNNDGYVNILDATIVLRKITGLPVSINTEKECKGINLDAF